MSLQINKSKLAKSTIRLKALNLFFTKGYDRTTIKDICDDSGYSIGAFYHHYESKGSIIDSLYRDFDGILEEQFEDKHFNTMAEGIQSLMTMQTNAIFQIGLELSTIQFKEQLSHGEKFIIDKNRYQIQKLKQFIETGIETKEFRKDIEASEYAMTIMRISIGDIYVWCVSEGSFDLADRVLFDLDLILNDMKIN